MKKIISIFLSLTMLLSLTAGIDFSAYAETVKGECGDNTTYSFNSDTGILTISGTGEMDNEISLAFRGLKTVVVEDGVTTIGDIAFRGSSSLTNVKLGKTVTRIGKYSFSFCSNLKFIVLPISVDNIWTGSFDRDNIVLYCSKKKDWKYTVSDCYDVRNYDENIISIKNFNSYMFGGMKISKNDTYYFIANETCNYYSSTQVILDESFSPVISREAEDGYVFQLKKGHRYYLPGGGKIIKKFQYVDLKKRFIEYDYNYNCLQVTFPDNTSRRLPLVLLRVGYIPFTDDYGVRAFEEKLDSNNKLPVRATFCGAVVNFKLSNPILYRYGDVSKQCAIDYKFLKSLIKGDVSKITAYPDLRLYYNYYHYGEKRGYYNLTDYNLTVLSSNVDNMTGKTEIVCKLKTKDNRVFYQRYDFNASMLYNNDKYGSTTVRLGFIGMRSVESGNYFDDCDFDGVYANDGSEHIYKSYITQATIKNDGKIIKKCSVCKNKKSTKIISKVKTIPLSKTKYTYNGKAQKPTVTVKDSKGKKLSKGKDYTVSYSSGRKNVGRYAVKIKLKGNYSGTVTKTFDIVPKGTSIKKISASKKSFKVYWKAQKKNTTGYEIQYSTAKSFKNAKTVKVSKNSATSQSVAKLIGKKKYFVRVRTYKTVKFNGKKCKVHSSWSTPKTVVTKK